jgi:hypothetical protein
VSPDKGTEENQPPPRIEPCAAPGCFEHRAERNRGSLG